MLRRPPAPRVVLGVAAASILLLAACGESPVAYEPVHRFVEDAARGVAVPVASQSPPVTANWPRATIGHDTRFVLAAPRHELILTRQDVPVPESGPLSFAPALPLQLARAPRLLLRTQLKLDGSWEPARFVVAETQARPEGFFFALEVPPEARGKRVEVRVEAFALDATHTDLRTRQVAIPQNAFLDLALGLVEPQGSVDPVRFSVSACLGERCEPLIDATLDPRTPEGRAWQPQRVSLAPLAGEQRAFRFEAQPLAGAGDYVLPVFANPTLLVRRKRTPDDLNVILLSIDTLRADHLPSYGYPLETAPFLHERFAEGGTLFERCVAAATTTTPSHMTIFTSLQPAAHGSTTGFESLPSDVPSLTEWVRTAGLRTGAITENGWLGIHHGFGRGFDTYFENKSANVWLAEGHVEDTFARAGSWLERHRDERFFLFLHTFQVHSPYVPAPEYADLFVPASAADGEPPEHVRDRANYDREIRQTDDALRSLFATLEALGLDERTVFIVTSDHGEEFLDHGLYEHGAHLYEEAVRVPLLFTGPGVAAGRRVDTPVGHVDFLPTILDLLGLPAPPVTEGTSLAPLLAEDAQTPDGVPDRFLFSESHGAAIGPDRKYAFFKRPAYAVTDGRWKLSRYRTREGGHRYELYDLAADVREQNDLFPTHAQQVSHLVELLEDYEADRTAVREQLVRGAPAEEAPAPMLDPEQEEKLRALGYIR